MSRPAGVRPRVLIAGGGVAGLEAALVLRALGGERLDVEVIAPEDRFVYRPFVVTEPFGGAEPWSHDLDLLLGAKRIARRADSVASVDWAGRAVNTASGDEIPYDALIVAMGAHPVSALPGALTFAGRRGVALTRRVLAELEHGEAHSIAFAVPPGVAWALPVYELALQTSAYLRARDVHASVQIVTPEAGPLAVFGRLASADVRRALDGAGISFTTAYPYRFEGGTLLLVPEGSVAVDRVVALPAHRGPALAGLPSDPMGFLPTDELGAVHGVEGVWAAGDITDFPIKQGGVAAQQADAAATAVAAHLGLGAKPRPFRPVLRGIVVGGHTPQHLRADVAGGRGEGPPAQAAGSWWPPAKIAGRYLAPYLAAYGAPRVPAARERPEPVS